MLLECEVKTNPWALLDVALKQKQNQPVRYELRMDRGE